MRFAFSERATPGSARALACWFRRLVATNFFSAGECGVFARAQANVREGQRPEIDPGSGNR
jgi:hypothetical protein